MRSDFVPGFELVNGGMVAGIAELGRTRFSSFPAYDATDKALPMIAKSPDSNKSLTLTLRPAQSTTCNAQAGRLFSSRLFPTNSTAIRRLTSFASPSQAMLLSWHCKALSAKP